jgi:hypothetical protein
MEWAGWMTTLTATHKPRPISRASGSRWSTCATAAETPTPLAAVSHGAGRSGAARAGERRSHGPDGGVPSPVQQRPAGALFIHADRCDAHGVADINAQQLASPQPRQQHRHHQGPFAYGPGQVAVFARLDDAHARFIVIYACNVRRDRAPPRSASVRIIQNALPISVDRTAPPHLHRDLMPTAQPAGTSAC